MSKTLSPFIALLNEFVIPRIKVESFAMFRVLEESFKLTSFLHEIKSSVETLVLDSSQYSTSNEPSILTFFRFTDFDT